MSRTATRPLKRIFTNNSSLRLGPTLQQLLHLRGVLFRTLARNLSHHVLLKGSGLRKGMCRDPRSQMAAPAEQNRFKASLKHVFKWISGLVLLDAAILGQLPHLRGPCNGELV